MKTIAPLYSKALAASKLSSKTALIKDYYASWRAAMNGVRPSVGETVKAYKARQTSAEHSLAEKAERI